MPLWSILSLSVCFATPSITTRYFRATSGSILEDDLVLALSTATGAALGFALAALGYFRKESPRWLNQAAFAFNALVLPAVLLFRP